MSDMYKLYELYVDVYCFTMLVLFAALLVLAGPISKVLVAYIERNKQQPCCPPELDEDCEEDCECDDCEEDDEDEEDCDGDEDDCEIVASGSEEDKHYDGPSTKG